MISLSDIKINKSQLSELLNHNEKQGFKYLLKNGVYCTTCNDYCKINILNLTIYLDRFNDIRVEGECSHCQAKVTRVMEFGENESFFRKAVQFRHTQLIMIVNE